MPKPQNEIRHKEPDGVTMKIGDAGGAGGTARAWSENIEDAPKDGLPVFLKDEHGNAIECYWRTTREFREGSWKSTGFWSIFGQNPAPISWTPVSWWREDKTAAA